MWSPSGSSFSDPYQIPTITATGAMDYYFSPRIATSAQTLVQENDVILIALPANGHKKVFDELAPWIQEGQHVIISSHSSLGALYLSTLMQQRNINIDITCWGTTVCTARSNAENTVLVNTIRSAVDFCTVPSQKQLQAAQLCCELFGDRFRPREGLLAISLSNLNPQNHLGIALGNISRIEKAEAWYQVGSLVFLSVDICIAWLFITKIAVLLLDQFENITPNIGRFLEELDQERLNIAKALKLDVKTVYEHFSQGFHVPITDSISDMNQEIHAAGKDVYGPKIADSRYVTEDVPFGLALIIVLGNFVNRPAILHQSGLQILSAMYGRDFMNENDLLDALNLGDYELEELKSAALTGFLKNNRIRSSI
jgi:opine dehydrogenase